MGFVFGVRSLPGGLHNRISRMVAGQGPIVRPGDFGEFWQQMLSFSGRANYNLPE